MIRFIDLGDQIIEGYPEFAWYNTVICKFETFMENQTWETWSEFQNDYLAENEYTPETHPLDRYGSLFPKKWRGG